MGIYLDDLVKQTNIDFDECRKSLNIIQLPSPISNEVIIPANINGDTQKIIVSTIYKSPKLVEISNFNSIFINLTILHNYEYYDYLNEIKNIHNSLDTVYSKFIVASIKFIQSEMSGYCNKYAISLFEYPVLIDNIIDLLVFVENKTITFDYAIKVVLPKLLFYFGETKDFIIETSESDTELESVVLETIKKFSNRIEEYKNGKDGLLNVFIGDVMKKTNRKFKVDDIKKLILEKI